MRVLVMAGCLQGGDVVRLRYRRVELPWEWELLPCLVEVVVEVVVAAARGTQLGAGQGEGREEVCPVSDRFLAARVAGGLAAASWCS
jgi:hypothetical protein